MNFIKLVLGYQPSNSPIFYSESICRFPFAFYDKKFSLTGKKFSLKSVFELMISNLLFLPFYYSEIAKSSFLAQLRWMITIECANLYVMTTKKSLNLLNIHSSTDSVIFVNF